MMPEASRQTQSARLVQFVEAIDHEKTGKGGQIYFLLAVRRRKFKEIEKQICPLFLSVLANACAAAVRALGLAPLAD